MSQEDEDKVTFQLSQGDPAAENRVLRMANNSRALRELRKPVHFLTNLHRYRHTDVLCSCESDVQG